MRYHPHIRCNIAYTPWPSAYCPPHVPLFTSATLHLLSVLLSHFQPNTDTGHLVLFEDCGSILLAVGRLDYIVITHMCPNLLIIFAREPQWAIWWSNQDLHLTCKGMWNTSTGTMLTPYRQHRRIHAVALRPKNRPALTPDLSLRYQYSR